jgi:hypothetical protein
MEGKRDDRDRKDRDDEEEDGEEKRKNPFGYRVFAPISPFPMMGFFFQGECGREVRLSTARHGIDCSMN